MANYKYIAGTAVKPIVLVGYQPIFLAIGFRFVQK